MNAKRVTTGVAAGLTALMVSAAAHAITITPDLNPGNLLSALLGGGSGLTVTGTSLQAQLNGTGGRFSGTYTKGAGTYGIGSGIVLSSGNVADYNSGPNNASGNTTNYGSNATVAQEALFDPITGGTLNHFDVTQLNLTFDVTSDVSKIFFNVVFGSED
jgi:hypothetical protein